MNKERAVENETKTGEKRPAMYHVIANSYREFIDKDHARLEADWVPARVAVAGRDVAPKP